MLHRTCFDLEEVQTFLATLPADAERKRRITAFTDARSALMTARGRDTEVEAVIAANTEALVTSTGKERERLLTDRARHGAERDALPGVLEILTRRCVEALVAACHEVHRQASHVHDTADAVIAERSLDRSHMVSALTRFEGESRYQLKADAKRAELREYDTAMQPHRQRREEALVVQHYIEGTISTLFGDGAHTSTVRPDHIERYVRRATRKAA
jgi:hypothetical protein